MVRREYETRRGYCKSLQIVADSTDSGVGRAKWPAGRL